MRRFLGEMGGGLLMAEGLVNKWEEGLLMAAG